MEKTTDLYGVLEVSPRASPEVIRAAYHALQKLRHPDAGGRNTHARFINEAYDVLSDPIRRSEYDRKRLDLGGKTIGPYRIIREIAQGGFARTYEGEHTLVGERVCLKHCLYTSPQDESILLQEAKTVWNLRHHALPAMRDMVRTDDGSMILVMSYIPGPTLEQVVKKVGRIHPEHVAWITDRVLNALHYMHSHGVVHGDVKPQNIIIDEAAHFAYLVDFGLSLVKPSSSSSSKGYTPLFAPPEEIAGKTLIPESDLYSLGMTMLYALNGGDVALVQGRKISSLVPSQMGEFIRRLLAKDVLSRPNWQKEDLSDSFRTMRKEAFGRERSSMEPIRNY